MLDLTMQAISVFDIFKIGVGPSSSHTLGPWNAALTFVELLDLEALDRIQIDLYGSLAKTGKGHATDKAIILGLMGHEPKSVDIAQIDQMILEVQKSNILVIKSKEVHFEGARDIIFNSYVHERHPNTLVFRAFAGKRLLKQQLFASVGGGFIESETPGETPHSLGDFPFPINKGVDILAYTSKKDCAISDIVLQNELTLQTIEEIDQQIASIFETMLEAIYQGCCAEGTLPGGLNVSRRAKKIYDKLTDPFVHTTRDEWMSGIQNGSKDFSVINKWVSCFALAVNEQNAAMGRIVTSPTNGAAGVIPSVLLYYILFCDYQGIEDIKKFLFTAGEIGCLFKKGATISAAVGGCQAEVGVSSAMAAAGLTEVLGGSPEQCLMAAEIAMEHHLGLTCDPVKGLVQVPCIERNTMGAIKAITAANLALESDAAAAIVNIDTVIQTMWDIAKDMHTKYKETSEGGLAINLSVIHPNC